MSRSASPDRRKSWKQTAATRKKGSSGAKRKSRWGFTLLAVALLGIFLYMMNRPDKPRTYFVQLPILKYDRLVPPVEYVSNDFAPLLPLPEVTQAILNTKNLDILQTANSVDELPELFANDKVLPKDILILFVSAHGFSAQGKPYIACSDFLRDSPLGVTGIYPLGQFLKHVDQCQASAKLIVLDTGRLQYDPRIGLLVNEFPQLLAEEMEKLANPNLFVLCGSGMMQYPNVLHDQRRTLFSSTVVDGLLGSADSQKMNQIEVPDDKVTLPELYKFVVDRMADYYPPESGMTQTAYLMQGGQGVLRDFAEIEQRDTFLISLKDIREAERAKKQDREAAAEKEKEETAALRRDSSHSPTAVSTHLLGQAGNSLALQQAEPAPASSPAAETSSADSNESTEPASETSPPSTAAAEEPAVESGSPSEGVGKQGDVKSPEDHSLRAALDDAWAARDLLQSRTTRGGWSPVDFAPHYWRLMNARLLDCERRYLAGADYDLENLAIELEAEVSGLERLASLMSNNTVERDLGKSSLASDHLLDAWREFHADANLRASYESAESSSKSLKQARLAYHDFVDRAVYYVAWHDRNSFSMADSAPGSQDIAAFLRSLSTLQSLLDAESPDTPLTPAELNSRLRPLQNKSGELDEIIADQLRQALNNWKTPSGQRQLYDLLATPLLTAEDRSRAISHMMRTDRKPPFRSDFTAHTRIPRLEVRPAAWRALSKRLMLQALLIKLVDGELYQVVNQELVSLSDSPPTGEKETSAHLEKYRSLGTRFSKFYRETLPDTIALGNGSGASDSLKLAAARHCLRMLDPRDVERVGPANFPLLPPLEPREGPREAMVQLLPEIERLELKQDPSQPEQLLVSLKYTGENSSQAMISLDFDQASISVTFEGRQLAPGKEFAIPLIEDHRLSRGELPLQVWAKVDNSQVNAESMLNITATVTNRTTQQQVDTRQKVACILPNKDFVGLVIQRNGAPSPRDDDEGAITLRPFPNRETPYVMELQNHASAAKQVTVKLLAIPKPAMAAWAPGRLFDRSGRRFHQIDNEVFVPGRNNQLVNSNVQELAATKPFSLPAGKSKVPIPFEVPGSEPAADAVTTQPPPAEEKPEPDISHGLAMVITDSETNNTWVKWIELRPRSPAEYMTTQVTYDATLDQIQVAVSPRLDDRNNDGILDLIPRNLSEDPIDISWDVDGTDLALLGAKRYDTYKGVNPQQPVELYVNEVKTDNKERKVWLTIDGYPRAVAYTILCAPPPAGQSRRSGVEFRQSVTQVKLKSLSMPSENYRKLFFYTPAGEPIQKLAVMAKSREQEAVFLAKQQPAYFPSARQAAPVDFQEVEAQLEIDATEVAFDNQNIGADVIEIGIEGDEQRFYGDRQLETRLLEITPQGQMRIRTTVSDYTVRIDTRAYSHRRTDFVARLRLNNEIKDGLVPYPIIFDDHPPQLSNWGREGDSTLPVPLEQPLKVFVEATALAGIDRVEFAIDTSGQGSFDQLEPQADRTDGKIRQNNRFSKTLETDELKPGRRYNVLIRAYDRIGLVPSETVKLGFSMAQAPAPQALAGQPAQVVKGTVSGVVATGTFKFPRGDITVVLEGNGETKRVTNGAKGSFRFDDVEVGPAYKLSAEGVFQSRDLYGELQGVKATPKNARGKSYSLNLGRDTR